jgi:predicted transposase YdaD
MKTMQEIDTIYRAEMSRASLEGEQRGEQKGRQEGRQEERTELILRLLNRRVGPVAIDLQTQIKALPLEQLGLLAEDLLDFSGLEDLVIWLDGNGV